jgi:hypothetical protein
LVARFIRTCCTCVGFATTQSSPVVIARGIWIVLGRNDRSSACVSFTKGD